MRVKEYCSEEAKKGWPLLIPFPCPDPFSILFPVARDRVSARRRYRLPDLSSGNTGRRLVSTGRLWLPSATNKPLKPVRHSSAGVQGHANHSGQDEICQSAAGASTAFFPQEIFHRISARGGVRYGKGKSADSFLLWKLIPAAFVR